MAIAKENEIEEIKPDMSGEEQEDKKLKLANELPGVEEHVWHEEQESSLSVNALDGG